MPITLHIFRKDARRLWKEIAGTLALLAWLTHLDSMRSGHLPGIQEGWLNLLLPFAWGCLTAVCILLDPLPGERQFWLALPCTRSRLIGAKALFLAAFIHLPYLISNIAVMASRGFAPWQFIPRLLQQQVFLLFAVTLPCLALATLVRNAMQFIVATIAVLGFAVVFVGSAEPGTSFFQPAPFAPVDEVRQWMALALLAVASVLVTLIQYRARHTRVSQITGATGILMAAALFVWLPPEFSAAIEQARLPAALRAKPVTVRLDVGKTPFEYNGLARNAANIAIPLSITGAPPVKETAFRQVAFDLIEPDGSRIRAVRFTGQQKGVALVANLWETDFEILTLDRNLFNRLANVPVTLRAWITFQHLVKQPGVAIAGNSPVTVPGVGRCFRAGTGGLFFQEGGLRAVCESPAGLHDDTVRLTDTRTDQKWEYYLNQSMAFVTYPRSTWLSPVDRKETWFQLTSRDTTRPGATWMAPLDIADHSRLEVIPRSLVGQSTASFELRGIRLSQYQMKPMR